MVKRYINAVLHTIAIAIQTSKPPKRHVNTNI